MSYITLAERRLDTVEGRQYARATADDDHIDAGHRLIWRLFSKDPDTKRTFIYRALDKDLRRFMIVSECPPEAEAGLWLLKSKPYRPILAEGQAFGFALRVNPTFSLSQAERKKSQRIDVLMHAKKEKGRKLEPSEREQIALEWLMQKLQRVGATLETDASQVMDYAQLQLPRKNDKRPAIVSVIDIEGRLSVRDPAALQKSLRTGIGHAKAFGLGLLLLRPLES